MVVLLERRGHSCSQGHPDNAGASASPAVTTFRGRPDDTDSAPHPHYNPMDHHLRQSLAPLPYAD